MRSMHVKMETVLHARICGVGDGRCLILPAPSLDALSLTMGSMVSIELVDGCLVIKPLVADTLADKLARFDPAIHGGEALAAPPVGLEQLPEQTPGSEMGGERS